MNICKEYSINMMGTWPQTRNVNTEEMKPYWSFYDELAVIDNTVMKEKDELL